MVEHFRGFFVSGVSFRAFLGHNGNSQVQKEAARRPTIRIGFFASPTIHKDLIMRLMFSPLGALLILAAPVPSFAEDPANIIRTAEAFTYKQLLAQGAEPMKYAKDCCSLLYSPGTPKSEYHFDLENAYFIRVTVDAVKLAPVLFRMSCQNRGFFTPTTECTPDELKAKIDDALRVDYPGSLYGKYRSSWVAKQNGQALPKTEKWGGQTIYSFKRENGLDEIVLGPIKGSPTTVELQGIDELSVTPAVSKR